MTVCILGNSLTALTLAKALVNQNIYVNILRNKKNPNISHTRTIGISKNNIDYFNKNIINVEKILWKIKKIEIFSENLKKEKLLNFEKDNEYLFSIIQNFKLIRLLEKDLSINKFFKFKHLEKYNLSFLNKYDLIINCDPQNTITNRYFGRKITKKYHCHAYTTIIKHDKILNNVAFQMFTKNGPLAFLPISDKETSIVFSVPNSIFEKRENIKELIKNKNFKYKIRDIDEINSFELKFKNLRTYYYENILAFGDLLHKIHPLAGQGFNMTIRDIKVLLDIVKEKLDLGLPLDKSVNLQFQNNIKHKNFIFSNGIDLIYELFNVERKMKNSSLSHSIKFIGKYPEFNKLFTKIADRGVLF